MNVCINEMKKNRERRGKKYPTQMHQKMYVINNPRNVCIHEMKEKN